MGSRNREPGIDRGQIISLGKALEKVTIGDLIDFHKSDVAAARKAFGRSKSYTLEMLKASLGTVPYRDLTADRVKQFGLDRSRKGAGPVTIGMDIGFLRTVVEYARVKFPTDDAVRAIDLGRKALQTLGLIEKSNERVRRPTKAELATLFQYFLTNPRQQIPMVRIAMFAVATGLRQGEIARVMWEDFSRSDATLLVRERKHPREKRKNDHLMPLVSATGFDPIALMDEQSVETGNDGRIFPYNGRSVGAAFTRACAELKIVDLHFHDLRHECISRLFEADWDIAHVASVSGHRDWNMLRRYVQLRPSEIAARQAGLAARLKAG